MVFPCKLGAYLHRGDAACIHIRRIAGRCELGASSTLGRDAQSGARSACFRFPGSTVENARDLVRCCDKLLKYRRFNTSVDCNLRQDVPYRAARRVKACIRNSAHLSHDKYHVSVHQAGVGMGRRKSWAGMPSRLVLLFTLWMVDMIKKERHC